MRFRTMAAIVVVLVLVAGGLILRGMLRRGLSALDEPSAAEAFLAGLMRTYSVPEELRARANPVPLTPEVLDEARAHFADHCAICHGNDGKAQTDMGQRMYPRVPDMTARGTRSRTDGELFAAIEKGIRLTGMPGFGDGTEESAYASWTLVHFIRHLPQLTPAELEEMEGLNPKPCSVCAAAAEEEAFLGGEEPPAARDGHAHRN